MMAFLDWLATAGPAYGVLAALFIASLLALVVQFVGVGDGADAVDTDTDAGGGAVFTLRNFTAFALGFSLVTLLTAHFTGRDLWAVTAGVAAGLGFVVANMALLTALARLSENGTQQLEALVGATGRVTVPVSENGRSGKALFVGPNARSVELPAVSSSGALSRGTQVRLVRLSGGIAFVAALEES